MTEIRVWIWFSWFVVSSWLRGDGMLLTAKPTKGIRR
jgi:hypothetical protein